MQFNFSAGGGTDFTKAKVKEQAESAKAQASSDSAAGTFIDAVAGSLCDYIDSVDTPSISVSGSISVTYSK